MKTAILINNIGTPADPTPQAVGRYLNEFLMDPEVIPLPWIIRFILVRIIIVPRRKYISAKNYKKIWTAQGSPLRYLTQSFADQVQKELGSNYLLKIGMNYGEPSLKNAVEELKSAGVEKIIFAPLFPQYAEATNGAAIRTFQKLLKMLSWSPTQKILPAFFDRPEFIDLQAQTLRPHLAADAMVLFSYHGLPEAQVGDYKNQCLATSKKIAEACGLPEGGYQTSFQSRLGRAEWIKPYSQDVIERIGKEGKYKRLLVLSPSFVTDCLETLEEIQIGLNETFKQAGGSELKYLSALNDKPEWVKAFAKWMREI